MVGDIYCTGENFCKAKVVGLGEIFLSGDNFWLCHIL